MPTVKLSTKGQIVIPKEVRESRRWVPGTEFEVVDRPDGILLTPLPPLPVTRVRDGLGLLSKKGRRRLTEADVEKRIAALIREEDLATRR